MSAEGQLLNVTITRQLLNVTKALLDDANAEIQRLRDECKTALADKLIANMRVVELETALEEFACTGTDEPCGCYNLLSKEKTEIARLQAKVRFYELGWDDQHKELQAEIARLRAWLGDSEMTVSKLRAALERLLAVMGEGTSQGRAIDLIDRREIELAREALSRS